MKLHTELGRQWGDSSLVGMGNTNFFFQWMFVQYFSFFILLPCTNTISLKRCGCIASIASPKKGVVTILLLKFEYIGTIHFTKYNVTLSSSVISTHLELDLPVLNMIHLQFDFIPIIPI